MKQAIFIMSTGRTSTQFLKKLLSDGDPKTVVVHEGAGPHYKPATVFRADNFDACVKSTPRLAAHLTQIENILSTGNSFIDTGWPTFSWVPYLSKRFEERFKFAHLVRDPFSVSASLNSHRIFEAGGGLFRTGGIITSETSNLFYSELASEYGDYGPFERGLFHWLEVNRFLFESHNHNGFFGLFRFEDLYSDSSVALKTLWKKCGFPHESFKLIPAFDAFQRTAPQKLICQSKPLFTKVMELALELGYEESFLLKVADTNHLSQKYAKSRLAPSGS